MHYIYGIIKNKKHLHLSAKGFGSENVFTIEFNGLAAIASVVGDEFSQESINKNAKDMKWLAKAAPVHERVIEEIMEKTTVIPLKFCTIFQNRQNLEDMLKENYAKFKEALGRLENKVEVGVKVYFDRALLCEEMKKEMPEIKKLEEDAGKQSSGAAYFTGQKIDLLAKNYAGTRAEEYAAQISGRLKQLSTETKENALWDKKITGRDMLLNFAILVDRAVLDEFTQAMKKLRDDYPALQFEIAGPFPPYNFVD